jgi:hypothetical protein
VEGLQLWRRRSRRRRWTNATPTYSTRIQRHETVDATYFRRAFIFWTHVSAKCPLGISGIRHICWIRKQLQTAPTLSSSDQIAPLRTSTTTQGAKRDRTRPARIPGLRWRLRQPILLEGSVSGADPTPRLRCAFRDPIASAHGNPDAARRDSAASLTPLACDRVSWPFHPRGSAQPTT